MRPQDHVSICVYADKNKTAGVQYTSTVINKNNVEAIYQRYLQAFKKGVYNYIKEEQDPITQQPIPRKYFSGGFSAAKFSVDGAMIMVNQLPVSPVPGYENPKTGTDLFFTNETLRLLGSTGFTEIQT